jgi:poly-gamma-glutamate capsule biosynthesis protein CapA/YwtB (metallophosphatase superfamily)
LFDTAVILFLCGDVMTGRGVDQILSHPGDPRLWEPFVRDARSYIDLAEAANGPIARPVPPSWPWGDALQVLAQINPDVHLINLETSITQSDQADSKDVLYRMNPANIACLAVAQPDACVLANNHVLDFGSPGLIDTLDTLAGVQIRGVGAGRDLQQARQPAVLVPPGGGRVIVFAAGAQSSGIPSDWAATPQRGGVNLLPDLSADTADQVGDWIRQAKRPGDIAVFSVHWGSNWGYGVPASHIDFAHRLIDHGIDIIHGHSSHHPRPIEVYRGKLIIYGAGDLIDDYEGIGGHEEYRDDLRAMYFPNVEAETGRLLGLAIVPLKAHHMGLHHASAQDSGYLCDLFDQISTPFGARVERGPDSTLQLVQQP